MPQQIDTPPLARFDSIQKWVPQFGDFVVWQGWVTTWFCVVTGYDSDTGEVSMIVEGTPALLFNQSESAMLKNTKDMELDDIKSQRKGSWSVMQNDSSTNLPVWYIR